MESKSTEFSFEYNTQQRKLPMPEYGRSVQNMVDHALTIADRDERQRCANTIVDIMGSMFPQLKDVEDFRRKLWDHLAIMSDFKLDIDYPVEIVKKENLDIKPDSIPYPLNNIRYRHYGQYVQDMIDIAVSLPDSEDKNYLIYLIANDMKKEYITWNKDGVSDEKILQDLYDLSHGKIDVKPDEIKLVDSKQQRQQQQQQRNFQQKKNKQKNKPNRKY